MISAVIPKLPFINKNETIDFYAKIGFQLEADYGEYLIFSLEQTELHFQFRLWSLTCWVFRIGYWVLDAKWSKKLYAWQEEFVAFFK